MSAKHGFRKPQLHLISQSISKTKISQINQLPVHKVSKTALTLHQREVSMTDISALKERPAEGINYQSTASPRFGAAPAGGYNSVVQT
jgi:hypothetical protein